MRDKLRGCMALDRPDTGIVGSNPAQDTDIFPHFFFVMLSLQWTDSPVQRDQLNCLKFFILSEANSET